MKTVRPAITKATIRRLHKLGKFPARASVDYMINEMLNKLEEKN